MKFNWKDLGSRWLYYEELSGMVYAEVRADNCWDNDDVWSVDDYGFFHSTVVKKFVGLDNAKRDVEYSREMYLQTKDRKNFFENVAHETRLET
jgi:hypothetical protein